MKNRFIKKMSFLLIMSFQLLYASNTLDILYDSEADIYGFQFSMDNLEVLSASGGDAANSGFTVSTGNNVVLGFSFSGSFIPAGSGVFLSLDGDVNQECLCFRQQANY